MFNGTIPEFTRAASRRASRRGGIALGAALALGLAGCGEEAAQPVETRATGAGIEVSDARLVLPPVSGNPAAIYFDVVYNGERGVSISGAEVEGAGRTEVHNTMEYDSEMTMGETGPVALRGGETKAFEPGGLHIMAFDLGDGFEPGGTAQVTLRISGGTTHDFEAEIRAAGEAR